MEQFQLQKKAAKNCFEREQKPESPMSHTNSDITKFLDVSLPVQLLSNSM